MNFGFLGDFVYFISQSSAIDHSSTASPTPLMFRLQISVVICFHCRLSLENQPGKPPGQFFCLRSNFEQIPNFSVLSVFFTAPATVDSGFGLSFVFECQNYLHS